MPSELVDLCAGCPIRAECLDLAVTAGLEGYWAGSTLNDRRVLQRGGRVSLAALDRLRSERLATLAAEAAQAPHGPTEGGLDWYRRGCHCRECRAANAANRARQRAAARQLSAA